MTAEALKITPDIQPDLMTVDELRRRTGIGRDSIYELIHSGQIGHIKVGRTFYVPRSEYERWLTNVVKRPVAPTIPFSLAPKRR